MPCLSRLVIGLAALDGLADGVSASMRNTPVSEQVSSAGPLFNLVKELRSEGASGHAFQQSMSDWCHTSIEQSTNLVGVLQRRLAETSTGARQLDDESRRIDSEETLANSTSTEKQHQLAEATATAKLASEQFRTQQNQLDKIQKATEKALQLVGQNSRGGSTEESAAAVADLTESLVQVPTLKMAVSSSGSSATELSNMLDQLQAKLQQDRGDASEDHKRMLAKLSVFTDDLKRSIEKSQSQVVQLKMEAAQRAREKARLDGDSGDYAGLIKEVERTIAATQRTCSEEDAHRGEVAAMIKAESGAVEELLRQLTLADPKASTLAGSLAFVQTSSRSSVAVRRLRRAPDDDMSPLEIQAASTEATEKDMDDNAKLLHKLAGMEAAVKGQVQVVDKSAHNGVESNALKDISAFVKADAEAKGISKTKKSLLARQRTPTSASASSAKHAAHRRNQCVSLLKKYAGQGSVLAHTSSDTMDGELQIANRALSGFEEQLTFGKSQHDNMQKQLAQFSALSKTLETSTQHWNDALRGHAEELMTLSVDLSQKISSEDQEASQSVRGLAQKLLAHVGLLTNRQTRFNENRAAVEATVQSVMNVLEENQAYSHRRIVQLTPEVQVLTSLAAAKDKDNTLANEYQELVEALCSSEEQKSAHL